MKTVILKDGTAMPKLGMGSWFLGEDPSSFEEELAALKEGIENGIRLLDTAEMYGNGKAEKLLGALFQTVDRKDLFLVDKVLPSHANRKMMRKACIDSLQRMGTDYLDLYLYHWRGMTPLKETVDCLEGLKKEGLIKNWGVSNFDKYDMEELEETKGFENCMVNQVLYHLGSRGIEYDLIPYLDEHHIPFMTYCPIAQGGSLRRDLLRDPVLNEVAKKYQISIYQLLICFTLRKDNSISIPRTSSKKHAEENAACENIIIQAQDWEKIDQRFPSPKQWEPLDIV